MPHGWIGMVVGVGMLAIFFTYGYVATPGEAYTFEQEKGQFEHLLTTYLEISKFIMTLAAGGIVLIISSSALSSGKKLPGVYAAPLFILAASIVYGVVFMLSLTWHYENFKHDTSSYTRHRYARNQALGFSSIGCFCLGYLWLIAAAVKG